MTSLMQLRPILKGPSKGLENKKAESNDNYQMSALSVPLLYGRQRMSTATTE